MKIALIALALALLPPPFANPAVTLIVLWTAGGLNDVVLRGTGQQASKHLDQPIVIDNRGGASVGPAIMAATAKKG